MENFAQRQSLESPFHISLLPGFHGDQSTSANVHPFLFRRVVNRTEACVCACCVDSVSALAGPVFFGVIHVRRGRSAVHYGSASRV